MLEWQNAGSQVRVVSARWRTASLVGEQPPEQPQCSEVPLAASVADDSEGEGQEKEPHTGAAGVAGVRIEGSVAQ